MVRSAYQIELDALPYTFKNWKCWKAGILFKRINGLQLEQQAIRKEYREYVFWKKFKAIKKENEIEAAHFVKDPYILEFAELAGTKLPTEKTIENALIVHLQQFLMELGKGFAFVARQQHIVTDTSDFYIDLVFYNYYLKCFVLIELKRGKLTHATIGQMEMYVRMYEDLKKSPDDNPTIGIILCTEKDETIVKYSVLAENKQLFASKYLLYLPKEDELKNLIENDMQLLNLDLPLEEEQPL